MHSPNASRRSPATALAAAAFVVSLCALFFALSQPVGATQRPEKAGSALVLKSVGVDQFVGHAVSVAPGDSADATETCPLKAGVRLESVGGAWSTTGHIGPAVASIVTVGRTSLYDWRIVIVNPKLATANVTVIPSVECLAPEFVLASTP